MTKSKTVAIEEELRKINDFFDGVVGKIEEEKFKLFDEISRRNVKARLTCPHCKAFDNKTIKYRNVMGEVNGSGRWGLLGGGIDIKGETRTGQVYCCGSCQNEWLPTDNEERLPSIGNTHGELSDIKYAFIYNVLRFKNKEIAIENAERFGLTKEILDCHIETFIALMEGMEYYFPEGKKATVKELKEKGYETLKRETLWEKTKNILK